MSEHLKLNDLEIKYQGNKVSIGDEWYSNEIQQSTINPFVRSRIEQESLNRKLVNAQLGELKALVVSIAEILPTLKKTQQDVVNQIAEGEKNGWPHTTPEGIILQEQATKDYKAHLDAIIAYLEKKAT